MGNRRTFRHRASIESLEIRRVLDAVGFVPVIDVEEVKSANVASALIDLDDDGVFELLRHDTELNRLVAHAFEPDDETFGPASILPPTIPNVTKLLGVDIDGDLDLDIVGANREGQLFAYLQSEGGFHLEQPPRILREHLGAVESLFAFHANGDGNIDLFVKADGTGSWLRNTGDGSFTEPAMVLSESVGDLAVGDVNGDGLDDVVLIDEATGALRYFRYHDAAFRLELSSPVGVDANSLVEILDVDADGLTDIVTSQQIGAQSWHLTVHRNHFDAPFETELIDVFDGVAPDDLFVAELTDDGLADLGFRSGEVYVMENLPDGDLHQARELPNLTGNILFADVDRDGLTDIVSTNPLPNQNAVSLALNGSTRILSTRISLRAEHFATFDFDSDGQSEIVSIGLNGVELTRLNDVETQSEMISERTDLTSIQLVDYDNDGATDILATTPTGIGWMRNVSSVFSEFAFLMAAPDLVDARAADFDNDGDLDLFAVRETSTFFVFEGVVFDNVAGRYDTERIIPHDIAGTSRVTFADLNDDGYVDLLARTRSGLSVLTNDGAGEFPTARTMAIRSSPQVFAADLDRDGDLDIGNAAGRWIENDNGVFVEHVVADLTGSSTPIDIDGDGDLDLLNAGHHVSVSWNTGDADQRFVHVSWDQGNTFPSQLAIGDFDGDGETELFGAFADSFVHPILLEIAAFGPGYFDLSHVALSLGNSRVVAAEDFDGDARPEVITWANGQLLYFANGELHSDRPASRPLSNVASDVRLTAFDVNYDGSLDLVGTRDATLVGYLNDGQANFSDEQALAELPTRVRTMLTSDIDADGIIDLLVSDIDTTYRVMPGLELSPIGSLPTVDYFVAYDANQDDVIDLAFSGRDGVAVAFGESDGTHREPIPLTTGGGPLAVGDVDDDGLPNLIIGRESNLLSIEYEISTATFTQSVYSPKLEDDFRVIDLDGDGRLDLLQENDWYTNLDDGFSAARPISPTRRNQRAATADLDGDGDLDVTFGNVVNGGLQWYRNEIVDTSFVPVELQELFVANRHAELADMDSDGDVDIVQATYQTVFWHEQVAPNVFARRVPIGHGGDIAGLHLEDLDDDGDVDVVAVPHENAAIFWIENVDNMSSTRSELIYKQADEWPTDIEIADVNNDGMKDVIISDRDASKLLWAEGSDDGVRFQRHRVIEELGSYISDMEYADLDGDGVEELYYIVENFIYRTSLQGIEIWTDPEIVHIADADIDQMMHLDHDGDGTADLFVVSAGALIELQSDGELLVNPRTVLDSSSPFSHYQFVDFTGDSQLDVVTTADQISIHEQLENGQFRLVGLRPPSDDDRILSVSVTPSLNSSTQPSMLITTRSDMQLLVNDVFGSHSILSDVSFGNTTATIPVDFDRDGMTDVITATNGRIGWRSQRKSSEYRHFAEFAFEDQNYLDAQLTGFDADGYFDLVTRSPERIQVWNDVNRPRNRVPESDVLAVNAADFALADLDGDASDELVAVINRGESVDVSREIQIRRIDNPTGNEPYRIELSEEIVDVRTGDVNGDSRVDIVVHTNDEIIRILLNMSSNGEFDFVEQVDLQLPLLRTHEFAVADFDRDGVADLVRFSDLNRGTPDGWGESQSINTKALDGFAALRSFVAQDVTGDGYVDLVTNSVPMVLFVNDRNGGFENPIGLTNQGWDGPLAVGDFNHDGVRDILTGGQLIRGVANGHVGDFNADDLVDVRDLDLIHERIVGMTNDLAFDLNSDGRIDLSDGLTLIHGVMETPVGDVDFDGVFGSADLVSLFQSREYDDGLFLNSTWIDGDWNFDGDFDSRDLIFAFQFGQYDGT